jgi:hypothetical protein
VHAVGTGGNRKGRFAVNGQHGTIRVHQRIERPRQPDLFVSRQVLFAQAYPAASGREYGCEDVIERSARLTPVGHQKKPRLRKIHEFRPDTCD